MTQIAKAAPLEETPVDIGQPLSDEEIFAEEVERRRTGEDPVEALPETPPETPPEGEQAVPPTPLEGSEGAPTQQVVEEEIPAWYADLSDEAKAAFDAMNTDLTDVRGQYTALHGRLAPMQQANERLREQATHAGQRQSPAPQNSSAKSGQQPEQQPPGVSATPALDLGDIPEFAEFQEAFPEEAKAIGALFGRQAQHATDLQTQLGQVSQGLQEIQQASFGQKREAAINRLGAVHPDWMQIRPSETFTRWLQAQPPSIARMADSQNPDECIYILDQYKKDVELYRQQSNPETPAEPSAQPPGQTAQTVRQRRQHIRSVPGMVPQGSNVGAPQGTPEAFMSDEEMWDEEVRRRLRAQRDAI